MTCTGRCARRREREARAWHYFSNAHRWTGGGGGGGGEGPKRRSPLSTSSWLALGGVGREQSSSSGDISGIGPRRRLPPAPWVSAPCRLGRTPSLILPSPFFVLCEMVQSSESASVFTLDWGHTRELLENTLNCTHSSRLEKGHSTSGTAAASFAFLAWWASLFNWHKLCTAVRARWFLFCVCGVQWSVMYDVRLLQICRRRVDIVTVRVMAARCLAF